MNSLQEMKEMDFSFEWGERASLWLHDFFSYCFIEENDLPWNQINNSIQFVINPDTSGGYIKTKEFQTRAVKHGEFFLDRKKIFWLMKKYDAILAIYHDQGLVPFKTLSFGEGVNFTAGLNKIRTSPDHGTGYDIAGKDLADSNSFKNAIFSAIEIFNKRKLHKKITENPLLFSKDKTFIK